MRSSLTGFGRFARIRDTPPMVGRYQRVGACSSHTAPVVPLLPLLGPLVPGSLCLPAGERERRGGISGLALIP